MLKNEKLPSLTITHYGHSITHQFDFTDPNIDNWFNAFKGLLIGITFTEEQFNNQIKYISEEVLYDEKN